MDSTQQKKCWDSKKSIRTAGKVFLNYISNIEYVIQGTWSKRQTAWMGGPTRCLILILRITIDEGMFVKQSYGLKWNDLPHDWHGS